MKKEQAGELSAILLEHQYTEAYLSLRKLKGNDQARARSLLAAAKEAGFAAHLALATYHRMGELEGGYSTYYDDEPEEETMGEVYEESLTISHWRDARDRRVVLGNYRIDAADLVSEHELGEGDPDEKEAEGYTGNPGCTMDYWYLRAAIVLWAKEDQERILCRYNFSGACASLAELSKGKKTCPGTPFRRLGAAVAASFPGRLPNPSPYRFDPENNVFARTLEAAATARSKDLLDAVLARVPVSAFTLCSAKLWNKLHRAFGIEAFETVYRTLAEEDPEEHRSTLFQILDALLPNKKAVPLATAIAKRLAELPVKEAPRGYWREYREPSPPGDREEARILLCASHLLPKSSSRKKALVFVQADSSLLYLRELLAPLLLDKSLAKYRPLDGSLFPEVFAAAKSQLEAEVNRPLEPYPDWTRPCPELETGPRGEALRELEAFMANPEEETHAFRRNQGERDEIEGSIRRHRLDLDCRTIKNSRPYTLLCTKNDQSYHRALARRAADEVLLQKLEKL